MVTYNTMDAIQYKTLTWQSSKPFSSVPGNLVLIPWYAHASNGMRLLLPSRPWTSLVNSLYATALKNLQKCNKLRPRPKVEQDIEIVLPYGFKEKLTWYE